MSRRRGLRGSSRWLLLVPALAAFVGCGGIEVASRWVGQPVPVDGDTQEWFGPGLTYVGELSGVVGAANSDSSLYLMVRFADPSMGRKITFGGATVWWNKEGKRKKDIGIRFAPLMDVTHVPERGGDPLDPDPRVRGPESGPQEGRLHNLVTLRDGDGETLLLEGEPGPFAAASSFHAGLYCYEVEMPLGGSGADARAVDADLGDEVHLCLELGELSAETEERMKQMRGERGGREEGGPGGGGMGPRGIPPGGIGGGRGGPGRMGGPEGGDRGRSPADMPQRTELWCTIRLATSPENAPGM